MAVSPNQNTRENSVFSRSATVTAAATVACPFPRTRSVRPAPDPLPAVIPDDLASEPIRAAAVRGSRSCGAAQRPSGPRVAIPLPRAEMLGRLALQAYEVLEGTRSLAQLGNLVSFDLSQRIAEQRAARQEQQNVYRDRRYATPRCGSIRACQVSADTYEAAVILHTSRRSYAVAMRLEWAHQRWRACDLVVL